jgi:tetratricopeptide (TPR) repeat protein
MKESQEGRRLHALAEEARESGDFLRALEYTDQATLVYQHDNDLLGLSEVQSSRQTTFKHLFRQTGDVIFLTLEKHAALAAVEIAEQSTITEALAIPYHNLGKYYFEAKEYQKAAEYFKKAVENLEAFPGRHGRPSVIADIKGHQYAAQYHMGDKTALNRALAALDELTNAEEQSTYNKNVWLSGAHLRIAEMLISDDPVLTKEHLKKAVDIVVNDERLILRKRQLEELTSRLK